MKKIIENYQQETINNFNIYFNIIFFIYENNQLVLSHLFSYTSKTIQVFSSAQLALIKLDHYIL